MSFYSSTILKEHQYLLSCISISKYDSDINQSSINEMFSFQSLKEQVTSLTKQKKDQEEAVKNAAPDEKTLKQLEKKVEGYRKGNF